MEEIEKEVADGRQGLTRSPWLLFKDRMCCRETPREGLTLRTLQITGVGFVLGTQHSRHDASTRFVGNWSIIPRRMVGFACATSINMGVI